MSLIPKFTLLKYPRIMFVIVLIVFSQCTTRADYSSSENNNDEFQFVFMTDIHLQPELGAQEAFEKVIDTANALNPDFILTGGDLVYDVLRGNFNRSDSLFRYYKKATSRFNAPVYNCIGNHELFGIYEESDVDSTHPDYKYGMYERHLGKTYYSFDHKGWHFIVLNSIDERNKRYIEIINEEQIEWLKNDLKNVDLQTPIAITTHVPFVSAYQQVYERDQVQITNSPEVMALFKDHNLKLALSGHLHWLEHVYLGVGDTHFISGGSVAGRPTWKGTKFEEEGFLLVKIKGEEISWNYIDYGWQTRYIKPQTAVVDQ